MRGILTIYGRELKGYFNTPIAYIFLPILIALMAAIFFVLTPFFAFERAEMRSYFGLMPWALFFVPAVTMRLWSEELRVGTAEILLTLPYKVHEIVIGKFLAAYTVLALALIFTFGIPLSLGWLGDPDWGPIMGGYLGSFLLGGMFVALGAFISSLTKNQVVALLFGLLAGIVLVGFFSTEAVRFLGVERPWLARFIEGVGVDSHFDSFERGVLALSDVTYFVLATIFFLFLNVFSVQARRY